MVSFLASVGGELRLEASEAESLLDKVAKVWSESYPDSSFSALFSGQFSMEISVFSSSFSTLTSTFDFAVIGEAGLEGGKGAFTFLIDLITGLVSVGFAADSLVLVSDFFEESFKIEAPTALEGAGGATVMAFFDLDRPLPDSSGTTSSLNLTMRSSLGLSEVSSFRKISLRFSKDEFRRRKRETSGG